MRPWRHGLEHRTAICRRLAAGESLRALEAPDGSIELISGTERGV